MHKVKLSWRILSHLDGTSLFQDERYSNDADREAAAQRMRAKVEAAPHRSDRSVVVELTDEELAPLQSYVSSMRDAARDSAYDPDARADYNAARALIARIGDPDRAWMHRMIETHQR